MDDVRLAVYADKNTMEQAPHSVCKNLLGLLLGGLHGIVFPVKKIIGRVIDEQGGGLLCLLGNDGMRFGNVVEGVLIQLDTSITVYYGHSVRLKSG